MCQWAGMREGGVSLPLAFQYLILLIWRPWNLNLVMISSLASKFHDLKLECLFFSHFMKRNWRPLSSYPVEHRHKLHKDMQHSVLYSPNKLNYKSDQLFLGKSLHFDCWLLHGVTWKNLNYFKFSSFFGDFCLIFFYYKAEW